MGDDRHTSASDELLGQARDGAMSGPGEFSLAGPDYDDVPGLDDNDVEETAGGGLSAEDIAASLAEMGAIEASESSTQNPDTRTQTPEPTVQTSDIGYRTSDAGTFSAEGVSGDPEPQEWGSPVGDAVEVEADPWTTASPEWEAYQAERAARKEARNRFDVPVPNMRALIGIAVLGFFALPVLFNVFSGTEHISSLGVGDCFTAGDAYEIENVPVVDCSEEHDSELFATLDAVALGPSYPGEDFLFDWAFEECIVEFEGYVGEPYEDSPYYVETLIPLEDGWGEGDHIVMCTVVVVDSDLDVVVTTGSRRGIASGDNA